MSYNYQDKVVIVTGGSKGIGKAITIKLAKQGAKVVVCYSSDDAAAQALQSELNGADLLLVKGDVAKLEVIDHIIKTTVDKYGRIDSLILCAATMPMIPLSTATEAQYDSLFNINVKSPLFFSQKAVPHMQPGSNIVFFSTNLTNTSQVSAGYFLYLATKGAVEQMVRVAAKELAPKGIRVNAVAPGPTGTDLFFKGKSDEMVNMIKSFNPHNRLGEPDEVANLTLFVASDAASWIDGQVLRVNGAAS